MKRQNNGVWKLTDDEMNKLSIFAYESTKYFDSTGSYGLSEQAREISNTIYEILEQAGYYKGE